MAYELPFPTATTLGQGSLAGTPGQGLGANPLGGYSPIDTMYAFDPYGESAVNKNFETYGGYAAGFGPGQSSTYGVPDVTASDVGYPAGGGGGPLAAGESLLESGAQAAGLSPGPGTSGGGTSGGGLWNPLCALGLNETLIGKCPPDTAGGKAQAGAAAAGGSTCGWTNIPGCFPDIGDLATRTAVVVLGFIFVAAGLFMFGRTVPFVRHAVPNVLKP
jgi:hypothetical protein